VSNPDRDQNGQNKEGSGERTMTNPGIPAVTDTMTIQCTTGPWHEGKPTVIQRLLKRAGDVRWRESVVAYGKGAGHRSGEWILSPDDTTAAAPDSARLSWNFKCHVCGFAKVARGENLDPKLDALAENAVTAIDLRHLARILG
jgi:hypothetical protein